MIKLFEIGLFFVHDDDEFPVDQYPNINYTKQNYLDLLQFGRKLNGHFDELRQITPTTRTTRTLTASSTR